MEDYIPMGGNSLIRLAFIVSVLVFSVFSISADIISINSGGSEEIIITSNLYIEGFFFSQQPSEEELPPSVEEPPSPPGPGGGPGVIVIQNILVTPAEFNVNLVINTNVEREIIVTNLGTSSTTVRISQESLDNLVILNALSFTIGAGKSVTVPVVFVALSETGIFTGKIIVGNKEVLVSLNIRTKLLLFDSNIIVLNKDYEVEKGDKLKIQVSLIPLGEKERLDVTLNYEIKDFNNKGYLTKSETLLIDEELIFKRDFETGLLPLGKYIIGLELVYPNGVAPSSASFTVIEKEGIFGTIIFYLIVFILIIGIFILIILIYKRRKKKTPGPSGQERSSSETGGQPL